MEGRARFQWTACRAASGIAAADYIRCFHTDAAVTLTSGCVSSVSQVSTEGALSDSTLPVSVLISRAPDSGPDVERVSTGTKFALELWLKSLETSDL